MENIPSFSGKMFYLAHTLYKDQKISLKEKGLFKELIIAKSNQLITSYLAYLREGTELTLTSDLMRVLHNQKHKQSFDQSSDSSPKKRQNIIAQKNQLKVYNIEIPPKNIQKISDNPDRI